MGHETDDSRPPAPASREGLLTFRAVIEQERSRRQIGPAHEPKRLRIYVSGPCTGIPLGNAPAFLAAELQLRGLGFEVINPTTLPGHADHDQTWASFMRVDLPALCTCDAVALLPGWRASKGAGVERDLALALGMEVRDLADWLKADHFRDVAQMVSTHRPAPACTTGQACVGAPADCVRQATQCRCGPDGCADGQCPGWALLGAGDSEGGEPC